MEPSPSDFNRLIDLFNAGHLDALEQQARALVTRYPRAGMGWKILGVALQAQGKDALGALQEAASRLPGDAQAQFNFGKALRDRGQLPAAEAAYRQALLIDPSYAIALCNLGNLLCDQGRHDEASASFQRALALHPEDALTHNSLGNALKTLGHTESAMASFRHALALRPDYAEAHYNLGNLLREGGQAAAAREHYQQALALRPDFAEAQTNLGDIFREHGDADAALRCFQRALQIRPDHSSFHSNLGNALADLGRLEEAIASYRLAMVKNPADTEAFSYLLFTLNYLPEPNAEKNRQEAASFGALVNGQAPCFTRWNNTPDPERPLRIGFVSGDFGEHPVGYFLDSVVASLNKSAAGRLHLFAYDNKPRADALAQKLRGNFHYWFVAAGVADQALAQRIRDDDIDVLIDLSGHTAHNRLPMFACKPAPVQAAWLGYFATTGVAAIDYLIADPWTVPDSAQAHFTESLWYLPETRLCFTAPPHHIAVSSLPLNKNKGILSFGCFNKLSKMNPRVLALWASVLHAVPGSRLFLKSKQLGDERVCFSVRERFAAHGIAAERLRLEGEDSRERYLTAYQEVDIALDPFPYPGGTTSVEALWMGVPVLTLNGDNFLARQGAGLLINAGLPDWIAKDEDDYLTLAVRHASDPTRLADLRAGLRQQVLSSPLFDATRFAGHFETALRGMWRKWCEAQTTPVKISAPSRDEPGHD